MVGQHISATDASGKAVEGDVLGMNLTSDGATLMLKGGVNVNVDSVTSVVPKTQT